MGRQRSWLDDRHGRARALARNGLGSVSDEARRAIARVKANLRFEALDNRPYFDGETEPCINGAILAFGSYFGERCEGIVDRLLEEQLADGGWNCEAPPSTRSSFHSTIRVLEGLLEFERRWGAATTVTDARKKAEEYVLERHMFRRLSTGEIIDRSWTRFAFPTMWHYDILRGLEYFRSTGSGPDERMAENDRRRRSPPPPKRTMADELPPRRPPRFSDGSRSRQSESLEYAARDARPKVVARDPHRWAESR